jgi:hypothetical protein
VCLRCRYRSTELLWQCPHCHDWNTYYLPYSTEHRIDAFSQLRQFTFDHTPYKVEIDAEVIVNEFVTHARDLPPWNGAVGPDDRILRLPVSHERVATSDGVRRSRPARRARAAGRRDRPSHCDGVGENPGSKVRTETGIGNYVDGASEQLLERLLEGDEVE